MSQLKITQRKSAIGQTQKQRDTLRGLGLRKIGHTVTLQDTPAIRGMVIAVSHLIQWEEVQDGE